MLLVPFAEMVARKLEERIREGGGKPQKTIQNADRLYKDPTDYTKNPRLHKALNIRHNPKRLNKYPKYLTR